MRRAGHMLHDYGGFAWKIFSQVMRDHLRGNLEAAAFRPDHDSKGFPFIKVGLAPKRSNRKEHRCYTTKYFKHPRLFHFCLLLWIFRRTKTVRHGADARYFTA